MNENTKVIDVDYKPVEENDTIFENEEVNVDDLFSQPNISNEEFNFNDINNYSINRSTKPKNLTKKQKRTRTKMVKSSRRKNRR